MAEEGAPFCVDSAPKALGQTRNRELGGAKTGDQSDKKELHVL